jgi:photosystem II stability/assembly factor-like uncharacterized protein
MNRKLALLILPATILFSCGRNAIPHADNLAEKSEPYDQFAFQRAYPDSVFDWQGWRQTLQQTRLSETAPSRQLNCGTNLSNWTQQGPMNVGARCNTLAAKPDDENTVLAGFSAGGIFKSTDGAVNWHPVFDESPELSIGDITFDPSNPNIVYAGTGDPNIPSLVFNGDGIYKSIDAGETWQHLPNSPSGIVSKVVVHPSNSSILWAATMGNPYVRDNQRGIYKSMDAGNSWQQVLFVSNQTGASDLVQCPTNPQILYASFWDRIRNNHESVVYGTKGRVYKSIDGGNNWVQLSGGLPTGVMGRSGLAISRTNPDKVYAVFIDSINTPGGLFKTVDGGTSWTPVNIVQLEDACSDFCWYFGKLGIDPNNDEELYFHAILLWRKPAGSTGWFNAGGGHADSHDLIFTASGRRYWSNDGGVYRNNPGQMSWTKAKNLPVTQFYRTNFNLHEPNTYWAGAQDNGIQKGNGVNPNGWLPVFSADGFSCAFDPSNAEHFWVEIQNGAIHETSDGGNTWQFGSRALGTSDRTNWDTPFFMSPNIPNKLYAATYRVYSKDSGGGWGAISTDLTDGVIFGARFHTISGLNESPVTVNKLIAGTSDGNVWRREAAGTWTNITAGLPNRYVTSVRYSPTLSNRIFVTHSGFRDDDDIPHIHRSDDNGATWQDISSDLPQMPVNDIFVWPGYADQVLFAATDIGVYFSTTGGVSWNRLGGNMPYIPVFDLEQNPVRKELVAATFARGIWTFPFDSVFVQQNPVTVSLAGTVQDELGIGLLEVAVDGTLSDDNGFFSLDNLPGCASYTLAPSRNDNPLNGLTTYDLVLISKHILGIEPFTSPYKMIAADANRSGSITTFDIVQLRKLILGIDTQFASNTSWRFVPANHMFENQLNPFQAAFPETLAVQVLTVPLSNLDFTAIKIGDVNNTAVPNLNAPGAERTLNEWPIGLRWGDEDALSGTSLEASDPSAIETTHFIEAFITIPAAGISAAQFTLQFDPKRLVFEKIESQTPGISMENFGSNRIGQGLLTFAAEGLELSGETDLFKVIFRTRGKMPLTERIGLANWPTPGLLYTQDGIAFRPVLEAGNANNTSITPNPFGLTGTWVLSKTDQDIQVFDARGRLIFSKKTAVNTAIHLESSLFPHAGTYFWRMGEKTGKLVFTP